MWRLLGWESDVCGWTRSIDLVILGGLDVGEPEFDSSVSGECREGSAVWGQTTLFRSCRYDCINRRKVWSVPEVSPQISFIN